MSIFKLYSKRVGVYMSPKDHVLYNCIIVYLPLFFVPVTGMREKGENMPRL